MDLKTEVEPISEPEQRELVTVSLRKGTLLRPRKRALSTPITSGIVTRNHT
jgi:hypothetical protein